METLGSGLYLSELFLTRPWAVGTAWPHMRHGVTILVMSSRDLPSSTPTFTPIVSFFLWQLSYVTGEAPTVAVAFAPCHVGALPWSPRLDVQALPSHANQRVKSPTCVATCASPSRCRSSVVLAVPHTHISFLWSCGNIRRNEGCPSAGSGSARRAHLLAFPRGPIPRRPGSSVKQG